ncbi:MAG: hypothetical protein GPJ54_06180 [Candidatus Heimdallarchaeota archaeon]|nr:hypothetical protein [Candidatus Heimdallarchaeota archaeon]
MKTKITQTLIILLLVLNITSVTAHNVSEIEEIELDVTPIFKQSRYGPVQVDIHKDSTIVQLGLISQFTIRHGLFGTINFTSYNVTVDGFEAYRVILHQEIILDDGIDIPLGKYSRTLSESALRDGVIHFTYILGDLNTLDDYKSEYVEPIDEYVDNTLSQYQYKINNYIEIIRGTKQNATLNFEYDISSFEIPNIPTDDFHKKITLITRVFPQKIEMVESSVNWDSQKIYLFLPIRLLPFYFQSPDGHDYNLTETPLDIFLDLNFAKEDRDKSTKVEFGIYKGRDQDDPLLDTDQLKQYKLSIEIEHDQVIPITISTVKYKGDIEIEAKVKVKAIFADSSLYAKNNYPLSPNQYILIMAFVGTVFVYKLVDYVDYRKFQAILAYKNYDIIEKDFIK